MTTTNQLPLDAYLLTVAHAVAARSTCRRKVGCVLADSKGRIIATGYNGPASGVAHCSERGCNADCCDAERGCSKCFFLGECDAVHAEINALIQCREPSEVYYVAVTREPCLPCLRALMNTAAEVVLYGERSSHVGAEEYWATHRPWGRYERNSTQITLQINVP